MDISKDLSEIAGREPTEEGAVTRMIEKQTAKVPSGAYLTLAVGSMIASLALSLTKKRDLANFLGLWAPTILILGLYNKIVKLEGSDRSQSGGMTRTAA